MEKTFIALAYFRVEWIPICSEILSTYIFKAIIRALPN